MKSTHSRENISEIEAVNGNSVQFSSEDDAMIAANNVLVELADELNSFYGHPRNRRIINALRV